MIIFREMSEILETWISLKKLEGSFHLSKNFSSYETEWLHFKLKSLKKVLKVEEYV